MMKKRYRSTSPNSVMQAMNQGRIDWNLTIDVFKKEGDKIKKRQKLKEPTTELLERLAGGKKQKVSSLLIRINNL